MIPERYAEFGNIILNIVYESQILRKGFQLYSAKVVFTDGSNLRVYEKKIGDVLDKYSYYWLDDMNSLIIGWDNAPHHPEVRSYPLHKHCDVQKNVQESGEMNLSKVLFYIKKVIHAGEE